MSQHERVLSKRTDIIEELACVRDEMSTGYMNILRGTLGVARAMARLDEIMLAVAARPAGCEKPPIPAERPTSAAPATQAASPPGTSPSAQSKGTPVQVGKGSDAKPEGVSGEGTAGQSEQFATRAGAGGESAASADTAPAVDVKPKRTFPQPLPESEKPAEPPVDPVVPRREPRVLAAGGGLVQGGPVPAKPYIDDTIRGFVLDTYAATRCGGRELEAQHNLTAGTSFAVLEEARGKGDARVKQGDATRSAKLTRQPAPRPVPAVPEKPQETSGEALMIIDPNGARIIGPTGEWKRVTPVVCKSLAPLVGGDLLGIDRMMRAGGWTKDSQVIQCLPNWTAQLARIGIDLVHTKGIGVKLNRRQVA